MMLTNNADDDDCSVLKNTHSEPAIVAGLYSSFWYER